MSRNSTGTLILACLAQFMVGLDVSVVNVALPSIRHVLRFTEVNLQWVVNAYTVAFAGFLLLGGRASDLLGRRRVFVCGLSLFTLASLLGGLARSETMLIGARALQGLGAAVIAPASLAIITTTFSDTRARNRAVGLWGAMGGAGSAAGVMVGGLLTQLLSWRWTLFINVPIGMTVAVLAGRVIAEGRNPRTARDFDLAGAVTATTGLSLLVLGIVRTDVAGWTSYQALALMTSGIILLAAFLLIEGVSASAPLMPLRMFRSRSVSVANAVLALVGSAAFAQWFFLSLYLQQVLGFSPLRTGIAFLPMTLSLVIGATVAPRLTTWIGAKTVLIAGTLALSLGLLLFTRLGTGGGYVSEVLAPGILTTFGSVAAFVMGTIYATAAVSAPEAGLASGVTNTSRLFGNTVGLALLVAVAGARTKQVLLHHTATAVGLTHEALLSGFRLAFAVAAVFAMCGAVAASAMPSSVGRVH